MFLLLFLFFSYSSLCLQIFDSSNVLGLLGESETCRSCPTYERYLLFHLLISLLSPLLVYVPLPLTSPAFASLRLSLPSPLSLSPAPSPSLLFLILISIYFQGINRCSKLEASTRKIALSTCGTKDHGVSSLSSSHLLPPPLTSSHLLSSPSPLLLLLFSFYYQMCILFDNDRWIRSALPLPISPLSCPLSLCAIP